MVSTSIFEVSWAAWWSRTDWCLALPGIVSAPVWDSRTSTFAGLLTSTDYINVIQYYCQYPDQLDQVDQFRLSSLRGKWRAAGMRKAQPY